MPPTYEAGRDSAYVGVSVRIRGEIRGEEDLYLDGEIEGNILLPSQRLVVGPNARIHGQIIAQEVLVNGKVLGNIQAKERLEIFKTGWVEGELNVRRIAIQEGAYFKGSVAIVTEQPRAGAAAAAQSTANISSPAPASTPSSPVAAGYKESSGTPPIQSSWLERKP